MHLTGLIKTTDFNSLEGLFLEYSELLASIIERKGSTPEAEELYNIARQNFACLEQKCLEDEPTEAATIGLAVLRGAFFPDKLD